MLEQISYPFADTPLSNYSNTIENDNSVYKSLRWVGLIIFLIFFVTGGFVYFIYKKKQKEQAELEKEELGKLQKTGSNV